MHWTAAIAMTLFLLAPKAWASCPDGSRQESPVDCPWIEAAQRLTTIKSAEELAKAFAANLPTLARMIAQDREATGLFDLWGKSSTIDDRAHAEITSPLVVQEIMRQAGLPSQLGNRVHAGLMHTYGYLLSLLQTPYGFKRSRWVLPTLDAGFGLEKGTLLSAHQGTLLGNASALFGAIAFQGDTARLADLAIATKSAAPSLRLLDVSELDGRRLVETFRLSGQGQNRTITMRTDVVKFPFQTSIGSDSSESLTHLLVYSIDDSAAAGARLVTGFPVSKTFADDLFAPLALGTEKPIRLRFNAVLPDSVSLPSNLTGTRSAVRLPLKDRPKIVLNDNDWPPFFFAGKTDAPPGLAKEILAICIPATGYEFEFRAHPIKRMRHAMEAGEIDINIYSHEKDRESFVIYGEEPLFFSEYRPVVRRSSTIQIHAIKDFDPLKLGHLNGLSYSPEFKAYVAKRRESGNLDVADTEESNLKKLLAGRIDVFVNSAPTVRWLAKVSGASQQIKVLDFAVKRADYFAAFSKASPRLSTREKNAFLLDLDACFRKVKDDGAYQKILAKYGLD